VSRFCLTIDDAPSVEEPGVSFDATRMDRVREVLTAEGWKDCCAFVVGRRAEPEVLRRWLDAGFALGNHTWHHVPASQVSASDFLASVDACDRLLEELGAFERHPRWFRFPHLDRGPDEETRRRLQRSLQGRGHRIAPASVEFYDHLFDPLFEGAASEQARRAVEERYLAVARRSLNAAHVGGLGKPLVAYVHFGAISVAAFPKLLSIIRESGFVEAPLEEALGDPFYIAANADFSQNGLAGTPSYRSLGHRVLSRANALAARVGLFRQHELGALWPYL